MIAWMEPKRVRDIQEALDEVHRELMVRKRCFPKWIGDGRVSETDAQDRVDRLASAHDLLKEYQVHLTGNGVTRTGDKTVTASA